MINHHITNTNNNAHDNNLCRVVYEPRYKHSMLSSKSRTRLRMVSCSESCSLAPDHTIFALALAQEGHMA